MNSLNDHRCPPTKEDTEDDTKRDEEEGKQMDRYRRSLTADEQQENLLVKHSLLCWSLSYKITTGKSGFFTLHSKLSLHRKIHFLFSKL